MEPEIAHASALSVFATLLPSRAGLEFEPRPAPLRSVPLREGFPHKTEDRGPVLHYHFQPAPRPFWRKVDAPEENPRNQVADLVWDGLICDRLYRPCRRSWAVGICP